MTQVEQLLWKSIVNIDKPTGMTSNDVVVEIKKLFNLKRCGHTGTLDPNVSGVLIVALENATKAMPVLMGLDKEYEGIMYLHKDVKKDKLKKIISKHFIGRIIQIPPVKSHVARKPRERKVYFFDILEKEGKNVKFRAKVESGTYIRKLIHDIGEKLITGAHMKKLRRIKVGHFSIEDSHTLDEVRKTYEEWQSSNEAYLKKILIPIEQAIPHLKRVYVNEQSINSIQNGAPILTSNIIRVQPDIKSNETVGIFSLKDVLIALGKSRVDSKGMFNKKIRPVIRTDRVL